MSVVEGVGRTETCGCEVELVLAAVPVAPELAAALREEEEASAGMRPVSST